MKITENKDKAKMAKRFAFVFFTTVLTGLLQAGVFAQPPDQEYEEPVIVGRRSATFLTPEAGIDRDQKILEGLKESYTFEGIIGQVPRLSGGMQLNYKGQRYTIYQDTDDPERQVKFDGINQGIKILIDKGIALPPNLTFYILKDQAGLPRTSAFCLDAQGKNVYYDLPDGNRWPKCFDTPMAQAFKRDRNWLPVARIVISSLKLMTGAQAALSSQKINGLGKIPITTIHEVCHILHERQAGEFFWTIPSTPPANQDVSNYASGKKKEFVAEVCAGSVLGLNWFPRVLTEYQQYRGPVIPR